MGVNRALPHWDAEKPSTSGQMQRNTQKDTLRTSAVTRDREWLSQIWQQVPYACSLQGRAHHATSQATPSPDSVEMEAAIDAAYSCPHLILLAYRFHSSEKVCGGFIGVMLHPRCASSVKMYSSVRLAASSAGIVTVHEHAYGPSSSE